MEQLATHVQTILCYGPDKDNPMGMLLHATGRALRLEISLSSELLVAPLILAEHVMHSWIKHVWVSTQECKVTLSTDFSDMPLQWQGDIELMHLFIKTGWKQLVLQVLNHCRMYLQVFLGSDIVTGVGSSIALPFWEQPHPAQSRFGWPKTNPPPTQSWTLW